VKRWRIEADKPEANSIASSNYKSLNLPEYYKPERLMKCLRQWQKNKKNVEVSNSASRFFKIE
jgi:hypothetical protein